MEITNQLRRRFCKETGILIHIYEEPYFTARLHLYNRVFPIEQRWEVFSNSLDHYKNEQDFYEDYNRVKEDCINYIKETKGFQRFNQEDMNQFRVVNTNFATRDVYKETNVGKWFLSIDMVKANFTALKAYDTTIFGDAITWEDFIAKFTKNMHFIESKYLRQVVMGTLNPKRQVTYEKYLMDHIMEILISSGFGDQIHTFVNDEVVVELLHAENYEFICKILNERLPDKIKIKTTLYQLHKVNAHKGYLLQIYDKLTAEMLDGEKSPSPIEIKLKGVSAIDYPFVLKELLNEDPDEMDKVFVHEGRLAKFLD